MMPFIVISIVMRSERKLNAGNFVDQNMEIIIHLKFNEIFLYQRN